MSKRAEYDYVIIGAGSAGCVIASRLAEIPGNRVLIIEAGGSDRHPFIRVPLGVGKLGPRQRFDWGYYTEPEPNVNGRRIRIVRGKVLGGSHSTNMMGYVRGNKIDYDNWAETGLPDWRYSKILPYFKKSESWEEGETYFRGGNGPLSVRRTKHIDNLYQAYLDAGKQAGHPYTDDYNGENQHGFSWCQWTIKKGKRCSTAIAYLHPVQRYNNITTVLQAQATKIIIDHERAVGVEYKHKNMIVRVYATREVILTGGTLNSPHLLMLSGVGPADHLREHDINPVIDLKGVGKNLHDHCSTIIHYERKDRGVFAKLTRADQLIFRMAQGYFFGTGPAIDVPSGIMAFLKSTPELVAPDIHFILRAAPPNADIWFPGLKKAWADGFGCRSIALQPHSRGELRLRSANPFESIRIFQNFFSDIRDMATVRAGFRLIRGVSEQPALDRHRGKELSPGSDVKTDKDIDDYIRASMETANHPVGTCKMGVDELSVVNAELKVIGIDGLRVADASIMPNILRGPINAGVIMIAERAAEMIAQSQK